MLLEPPDLFKPFSKSLHFSFGTEDTSNAADVVESVNSPPHSEHLVFSVLQNSFTVLVDY
jgi:hypothetical protein